MKILVQLRNYESSQKIIPRSIQKQDQFRQMRSKLSKTR